MKQKIEWYKEVLELEPSSRVFFPLAKQLHASSQILEAIAVLQRGLSFHPSHLEAKLLLIELLAQADQQEALTNELTDLSDLFCRYPFFWSTWSSYLARNPVMQDASLALRFFAAALSGQKITWASVIDQGLAISLDDVSLLENISPFTEVSETESVSGSYSPALNTEEKVSTPIYREKTLDKEEKEDDQEEPFSLRTRSMADVLAEQGDIHGALEIYRELLLSASSEDESKELSKKIEELTQKGTTPTKEGSKSLGPDKSRLDILKLVENLEIRAR